MPLDSSVATDDAVYDFAVANFALDANTRYWIQVSGPASSVNAHFAVDASGVGTTGEYHAYYDSGLQVVPNSDVSNGGPYQMQVSANAVPEPGTLSLAMSALGIGLIGMARRRLTRS